MVTEDYILAKVRKLAILPTFPKIVSEILGLIADPMSSASDLARHMDPSMTGEVLRIANTAYFGTSNFRRIYSAERAIAVMGYEHLSFIILQMPFLALINTRDTRFDKKAFVNHSVACGILSRDISTLLFETDHNQVYVSGILHDIGRIILYHLFKEEWQTMLKKMEEDSLSTVEAERGTFLMDHGQVGAMLLDTLEPAQAYHRRGTFSPRHGICFREPGQRGRDTSGQRAGQPDRPHRRFGYLRRVCRKAPRFLPGTPRGPARDRAERRSALLLEDVRGTQDRTTVSGLYARGR